MTWFVIRHIPTGKIIPCAHGRMDRGGSWVEPTHIDECLPRIFSAKRYAKGWLTTWLKGAIAVTKHRDWDTGIIDDVQLEYVPQPHRIREEYRIVEITFTINP